MTRETVGTNSISDNIKCMMIAPLLCHTYFDTHLYCILELPHTEFR